MYKNYSSREHDARISIMKEAFRIFANKVSTLAGTAGVFTAAILLVVVWALSGPVFNYSEKWQLVINTLTTIVTFLMVFLIQNTQNRDGRAMQLKLDELIRTNGGEEARQSFIDLEDISDEELEQVTYEFKALREQVTLHPAMHKLHKKVEEAHKNRLKSKG